MPTYGTHTPDVKYVPSSLMAFGYKGVKPVPGVPNMYLKDYQDNLFEMDIKDGAAGVSNCNFHWNDCDIAPRFGNHEDRVADKDIKYRPNVANICPRPKDWKPGKYQSKGVDGVDVNYPRIDERNRKYWGSAGGSHAKTFPSDE
ncbi:predicted protein [Micromonas commoda]|uniref:Uncharacterized protein n=1 Tax=Micromonas commoda (strain RCC299 / NOUM17 / CCMP2709) TaxID=296587 RepID=C1E172_MICCC|nr:predicted protein [Micromonas commoda]ACO62120.1 predicted protein [Micromonas commoda]|eukprot:XP_002500862.1 predicted protein [Micromonas commoda]